MKTKERFVDYVIKIEGGYVDHKDDPGGKTKWGITEKVAREWGYTGEMEDMPREEAFDIYAKRFWDKNNLDRVAAISEKIAWEVGESGVNCGTGVAAQFLQRGLNVLNRQGRLYEDIRCDAQIGNKTIGALSALIKIRGKDGEIVLLRILNSLQGNHYVSLCEERGEKFEEFVFGWYLNRVKL